MDTMADGDFLFSIMGLSLTTRRETLEISVTWLLFATLFWEALGTYA